MLLSSLTNESVTTETLSTLVSEEFLNPIIGSDKVLAGFTEEEAEKIMDGEQGRMSLLCDIGVPASTWGGYVQEDADFFFTIADNDANQSFYFAAIKNTAPIKWDYTVNELESLDPRRQGNQTFLAPEIYRVAEIANTNSPNTPRDSAPNHKIIHNESYVTEIIGMPFPYHAGPRRENSHQSARTESVVEPPSRLLVIDSLLDLLADRRLNQSGVIQAILERHPGKRGLGQRTLETIFAAARKASSKEAQG